MKKNFELTPGQKTAVTTADRNVLVSAGAGTGKTSVLVERFLHFVTVLNVPVTEILALTYTEKAANEMKRRIMKKFAEMGRERDRRGLEAAYISTIHAFCARLLREHPFEAGVDPDFRVIESEESDFLKEQALEAAFEKRCEKGNDIFELLRVYGEGETGRGILKVFDAARHDGKTLAEFFALRAAEQGKAVSPVAAFEKLGEKDFAAQFQAFEKNKTWTWDTVEDYQEWTSGFSRKRGKKGEEGLWKEAKACCADFLARKMDDMAGPWAEKFESLALSFEEAYEALKKEKGFLDFEDLQMRAVKLFRGQDKVSAKLLDRYRKKFRQVMVDEFQDTNPLQLELVELLSTGRNLFFVGDFKQSIYSFRGAEPSLFLDKEREYEKSGTALRVPLLENYRTSAAVLGFINRFFAHLWQEEAMPFEALTAGVKKDSGPGVELLTVEQKEGESMDLARMREASAIAERILQLHAEGMAYGEIAVLFQVMTDIGLYEQALKKRGIPYYSIAGTGFYHQPEIRDMVSFLSFLENPLADIPLAAALRSPLFQVKDDTLFWLSQEAKGPEKTGGRPLFEGVKRFESIARITEEEKKKVGFFLKTAGELLSVKDRLKIPELLDLIMEKTSYELTVLADPQGVRRYANLKKMLNLAREFESVEPLSLGAFLGTLRRLETHEVRESEAQVEAVESGRVVQLLSIHRSKGLEFGAVFVADLARRQRAEDTGWLKALPGAGAAIQVYNPKTGKKEKTSRWIVLDETLKAKKRQEWKRLFYVAATRAKEKLIFTGVRKGADGDEEDFTKTTTWMDWLTGLPQEFFENVTMHPADGPLLTRARGIAEKKVFEEAFRLLEPRPAEEILPDAAARKKAAEQGGEILKALEQKPRTPARVIDLPVSAYAVFEKSPAQYRSIYEIGYPEEREAEPENISEEEPEDSYADFGTAVHRVMELLDFQNPEERLDALVMEACAGMAPEKKQEAADIVRSFCKTPLFERLRKARRVYREIPFIINQRHGRVEGVIDVLFQEGEDWHVLDYKTATGDAAKAKEAGYELQIAVYGFAVHRILKISPKSGIIYFLKNHAAHTLPFSPAEMAAAGKRLAGLQENILGIAPAR